MLVAIASNLIGLGRFELMSQLDFHRQQLNEFLDNWQPPVLLNNWLVIERRIRTWWGAYKLWEKQDTFDTAFHEDRMTVRTFEADFDKQVNKKFDKIQIEAKNRFMADSNYTALTAAERATHHQIFNETDVAKSYRADRGIDSSAFAVPGNFTSRERKYEMGLHDLSASLLNHSYSIFDQVHNKANGAHYSLLPLSNEADQEVIYKLTQYAKDRITFPQLYPMVRGYRAEMTRLKLAQDFDMAIGYTAITTPHPPNECGGQRLQYKLRYGLAATTTVAGVVGPVAVTPALYNTKRQAARSFKQILLTRPGKKNEVLIAVRQHAGPFPVYAVRNGNVLQCYDIVEGQMKPNGKTISSNGQMT
jgi:hypothetical protein